MLKKNLPLILACLTPALFGAEKTNAPLKASPERSISEQGVEIFRVLTSEHPSGNLLFSPYSLQNAFALLYPGVKGEGAKEFARLGFGALAPEDVAAFFVASQKPAEKREEWEGAAGKFHISNSLWMNKTEPELLPNYRALTERYFGMSVFREDFSESAKTAEKVNAYIAKQTEQLIKKLISPDAITRDLAMILLNTVYFEQNWAREFYVESTEKADFQTGKDTKVRVDMMFNEKSYSCFEAKDANLKGILLPYQDSRFELLILMPSDPGADAGVEALGKLIASPDFMRVCCDFSPVQSIDQIKLYLPRVNAANVNPLSLQKTLKKHGFSAVFDPQKADLSGINGSKDLYLSEVFQQVVFQMDEKGTRAAAATALMVECMSLPPPAEKIFRVDRPFVLALRDRKYKTLLFLARIENPVQFPTPAPKAEK